MTGGAGTATCSRCGCLAAAVMQFMHEFMHEFMHVQQVVLGWVWKPALEPNVAAFGFSEVSSPLTWCLGGGSKGAPCWCVIAVCWYGTALVQLSCAVPAPATVCRAV